MQTHQALFLQSFQSDMNLDSVVEHSMHVDECTLAPVVLLSGSTNLKAFDAHNATHDIFRQVASL